MTAQTVRQDSERASSCQQHAVSMGKRSKRGPRRQSLAFDSCSNA